MSERLDALRAAIWDNGFDPRALADYQAACRDYEAGLDAVANARRHRFVILIPAADSPQQLARCLDSLRVLCHRYHYGGYRDGRFPRVSVLLADDSADPAAAGAQRQALARLEADGIATEYFGLAEQLQLLDRLAGLDLSGIVGRHRREAFGHKGQGMMRNIAYLRLAEIAAARPDEPLLFYTIDADQLFEVRIADADGGRDVAAVNYLFELDRLFAGGDIDVLTGKVVGDPPVSPAVMAGRFLDDVGAFVAEMADADPAAAYRQPALSTAGSGEAAYHDMADLFGFARTSAACRYRCRLPGAPTNADCLDEFAARLNSFFHGEHPTRITWYRPEPVAPGHQPARTVYTGNYVFNRAALDRFVPFAPLRLRMSGPTMGRILQAALGARFASANLPMLHRRTLADGGASEFRPGVVDTRQAVDLGDEFERQFHGDVMLFTMERLVGMGYPATRPDRRRLAQMLDEQQEALLAKYQARQHAVLERLARLRERLDDPAAWWSRAPEPAAARAAFSRFCANIAGNFGDRSPGHARIEDPACRAAWRQRQLDALLRYPADRAEWQRAVDRLGASATA